VTYVVISLPPTTCCTWILPSWPSCTGVVAGTVQHRPLDTYGPYDLTYWRVIVEIHLSESHRTAAGWSLSSKDIQLLFSSFSSVGEGFWKSQQPTDEAVS